MKIPARAQNFGPRLKKFVPWLQKFGPRLKKFGSQLLLCIFATLPLYQHCTILALALVYLHLSTCSSTPDLHHLNVSVVSTLDLHCTIIATNQHLNTKSAHLHCTEPVGPGNYSLATAKSAAPALLAFLLHHLYTSTSAHLLQLCSCTSSLFICSPTHYLSAPTFLSALHHTCT